MTPIHIRPAAAADVEDAYIWYEGRQPGVGEAFLAAVDSTLHEIAARPTSFPVVHKNIHRALLKRFPYAIFYQGSTDLIIVVACMHARRDPERWRSRVR